jgi:hypothetical protein
MVPCPAIDALAQTLDLGSLLDEVTRRWGAYDLVAHWTQGEFHHDVVLRLGEGALADLPARVLVVATNCNGGVKEVLCFDDAPGPLGALAPPLPGRRGFRGGPRADPRARGDGALVRPVRAAARGRAERAAGRVPAAAARRRVGGGDRGAEGRVRSRARVATALVVTAASVGCGKTATPGEPTAQVTFGTPASALGGGDDAAGSDGDSGDGPIDASAEDAGDGAKGGEAEAPADAPGGS